MNDPTSNNTPQDDKPSGFSKLFGRIVAVVFLAIALILALVGFTDTHASKVPESTANEGIWLNK